MARKIDPTKNVLQLVAAANRRQDDLRRAEARHQREIRKMDRRHARELRDAEEKRAATLFDQGTATAHTLSESLRTELAPLKEAVTEMRQFMSQAAGAEKQTGETRLSLGAILGVISVVLVFIFGSTSVAIAVLVR